MPKPIASVYVGIARLAWEVSQVPDGELAGWTSRLVRCLATGDKAVHEYGAFLLTEAEDFRRYETERKRDRKLKTPTTGGLSQGIPGNPRDSAESLLQTDRQTGSKENSKEKDSAPVAPPPDLFREVEDREPGKNGATPPGKAATPRKPDPVFDAVVRLFGFPTAPARLTSKEARRIGAVARDLREMGAATAAEVEAAYRAARKAWNGGPPFSPEALVKWWRQFRQDAEAAARKPAEELQRQARQFHNATGSWPSWYRGPEVVAA